MNNPLTETGKDKQDKVSCRDYLMLDELNRLSRKKALLQYVEELPDLPPKEMAKRLMG